MRYRVKRLISSESAVHDFIKSTMVSASLVGSYLIILSLANRVDPNQAALTRAA